MAQQAPSGCVRCDASSPKQTLLTSSVAYYSCLTCRAVWNVERNASEIGSGDEPKGPQRRRTDGTPSEVRS